MRLVIFRGGLKAMSKDLKMLRRQVDKKLGVPISTAEPLSRFSITEENVLTVLAEDYLANPGLYMTLEDIKVRLIEPNDSRLYAILEGLESKDLIKLYRGGKGSIDLAKATYAGLRKTATLEK
jgi:hypothetical protein